MEQVRKGLWSRLQTRVEGAFGLSKERLVDIPWLTPRIERSVDAIGECMFPEGADIPYSAKDVKLTEYMIDYFRKIPVSQANMLCSLMLAYEYALPLLYRKGRFFSELSIAQQTEILEHLHDSRIYPIRMLNIAVRMFMSFGYMADERVLREMGYFKTHEYPNDPRKVEILDRISLELLQQPFAEEQLTDDKAEVVLDTGDVEPVIGDSVENLSTTTLS